jgi:hypothetical protein
MFWRADVKANHDGTFSIVLDPGKGSAPDVKKMRFDYVRLYFIQFGFKGMLEVTIFKNKAAGVSPCPPPRYV